MQQNVIIIQNVAKRLSNLKQSWKHYKLKVLSEYYVWWLKMQKLHLYLILPSSPSGAYEAVIISMSAQFITIWLVACFTYKRKIYLYNF